MEQVSVTSVYMWALVVMVVFFLLAVLIANMIPFKHNDPGTTKRRVWFWILFAATLIVSFVITWVVVAGGIQVPTIKANFEMHACIASGSVALLYVVLGFLMSKIFSSSKIGTWF